MKSPQKTNAARFLDRQKKPYELINYPVDENDLSAVTVAAKLNENIKQVFKTLVLRSNTGAVFVCAIPGDAELNLKAAAKVAAAKKAEMVAMKELLPLTGYIRGGCSPIGMKKNFPVYLDQSCLNFDFIYISAGKRGTQIKLDPRDLIEVSQAETADLIL